METKTKWQVGYTSASDLFGPEKVWMEDGYYDIWPDGWVVLIRSDYGHEYYHQHRFSTKEDSEAFHNKVNNHLENGGQPNLDYWEGPRVIYGSQAYIDEEPYIVNRERDDAR
jgi:hypothetical protein